jgi:biotin synthase
MTDTHYAGLIDEIERRVLAGGAISREEAETLLDTPDNALMRLLSAADRIRAEFKGTSFDSCALINARSGRCTEDCAFCAQSGFHRSECAEHGLVSSEAILEAARRARGEGVSRFCAVTSGGALDADDFERLCDSFARVRDEVPIALDASLGFLDTERAAKLKDAGVTRYNHNLETSREHYPAICTTHEFQRRVDTVKTVKESGLSACCGGILGLGETPKQRLDLAFTLADLGVDCVPINVLNPRPGTRLERAIPPSPLESLKTVALFRLILPDAVIKLAGGREANLGDFQGLALRSGVNGMIMGGYLTTGGRQFEEDRRMVLQAGFVMARSS